MTAMIPVLWLASCAGPDDPGAPGDDGPTSNPSESVPSGPGPVFEQPPTAVLDPHACDAGDAAWVARAMPLVWGRKPHGAVEVGYWAQMAAEHGREATARAMTLDPEYYAAWLDWFTDALYVARTGDKQYDSCFERPLLASPDGSLARWIRTRGPMDGGFGPAFDMADVIVDGLIEDDVSVVYRAHLFARMNRPVEGANVSDEQLEYNRRVNFGELFYRTYLGRNLGCMLCHNSQFSTTDAPETWLDRTWQIPGDFEAAIVGDPTGRPAEEAYAIFRYDAVTSDNGREPWGMDDSCGEFLTPGGWPEVDDLGQQTGYFIREYGPEGSIYDVERDLAAGVDALDGVGLAVGADGEVGGPEAFAYLVATNLASQVWATATGNELVIAHWFPRNEGQMRRLKWFADVLVTSRFSMRELLVAVTTDSAFDPGLPVTCDTDPYPLDPVFDPWTVSEEDPVRRKNGPGDAVHRLPARALLRTAHENLGWRPREGWFDTDFFGNPLNPEEEDFQSEVGVFLRESDPGHRGTDFQGLLAFETELGTCTQPPAGGADYVDGLLAEAIAAGATVGDVVSALKDRLTSTGVAADEQRLIEDLLEASFADPASAELEERLRLVCGAILMSPQFQLVTDPEPAGVPVTLGVDAEAECQRVADRMTAAGTPVACDGTVLRGPDLRIRPGGGGPAPVRSPRAT
ncbi:MAG: hypothetical protein ABMB14_14365, partial [Myxococcota bacterium]